MSKAEETGEIGALLFLNERPHPIDKFVGERVKYHRKQKKLTQTELGEKLGLTFQQIQKYEKGSNRIGASRLFLLSCLLEVPVHTFFDGLELEFGTENAPGFGETPNAGYAAEPISAEERHALQNAFAKIGDATTRKRIIELVRAIGEEPSGSRSAAA